MSCCVISELLLLIFQGDAISCYHLAVFHSDSVISTDHESIITFHLSLYSQDAIFITQQHYIYAHLEVIDLLSPSDGFNFSLASHLVSSGVLLCNSDGKEAKVKRIKSYLRTEILF